MSEPAQMDRPAPASERDVQPYRWPLVVIGIGGVMGFLYFAKWELVAVLVSILATFILAPIVEALARVRIPRGVGSLIAVLLLVGALYGLAFYSYNQASSFVEDLPKYSSKIRGVVSRFKQRAEKLEKTTQTVLQTNDGAKNTITVKQASDWTDTVSKSFGSLTHVALVFSFVPFLIYFMLTGQQHARAATVMLFPMENRHTAYVTLGLISAMIRSFLLGNFLVGLFISGLSTAVFALMHVPYFYVVGVISGFLSLIPYLGVILAAIVPLMVSIGQLQSSELLIILLTVAGLHLFGLNVLYPKFLGSRLQLNPLAVTIALLFWGWLWGAMGLILAIPITAALKIIFDHVTGLRAYGTWLGE